MVLTRVFNYVKIRGRYYPMILIAIKAKYVTKLYALVDSGATISLFHASIAEDAGIDLSDAKREYLAGVGGYVPTYIKNGYPGNSGSKSNKNTSSVHGIYFLRSSDSG